MTAIRNHLRRYRGRLLRRRSWLRNGLSAEISSIVDESSLGRLDRHQPWRTISCLICGLVWSLAVPTLGVPIQANDSPHPLSGRKQLFLDDDGIAEMHDLRRTLHRPSKRGAVIRSSDPSQSIQIRTAPVWDPIAKLYKIWLLGTDGSFWTSHDGLNWTAGPRSNLRTDHVVYDPFDPDPNRRFKAAQTNEYFAVSPNGVDWTKLAIEKVQSSDESNLSFNPTSKLFIHTVKRGTKFGRSVAIAVSRDFQTWDDLGVVFKTDEIDQQRCADVIRERLADRTLMPPAYVDEGAFRVNVYNMGVFYYKGLYVGLPALFYSTGPIPNYPNTDGFHLIQLAVSRNWKDWHRVCDRATVIGPSRLDSGDYDLMQILPPSAPVDHGDELWFYYTGLKYRSTFHYIGTYPNGRAAEVGAGARSWRGLSGRFATRWIRLFGRRHSWRRRIDETVHIDGRYVVSELENGVGGFRDCRTDQCRASSCGDVGTGEWRRSSAAREVEVHRARGPLDGSDRAAQVSASGRFAVCL